MCVLWRSSGRLLAFVRCFPAHAKYRCPLKVETHRLRVFGYCLSSKKESAATPSSTHSSKSFEHSEATMRGCAGFVAILLASALARASALGNPFNHAGNFQKSPVAVIASKREGGRMWLTRLSIDVGPLWVVHRQSCSPCYTVPATQRMGSCSIRDAGFVDFLTVQQRSNRSLR